MTRTTSGTPGADVPGRRGRTGLNLTGLDLDRETHDRGNGATILLCDRTRGTVLLTRQFRYPVYVNGHPDGMLLETAAGLLDEDEPEVAIRREAVEETVELSIDEAVAGIGSIVTDAKTILLLSGRSLSGPFSGRDRRPPARTVDDSHG